jgi:hypothetical protein
MGKEEKKPKWDMDKEYPKWPGLISNFKMSIFKKR